MDSPGNIHSRGLSEAIITRQDNGHISHVTHGHLSLERNIPAITPRDNPVPLIIGGHHND